MLPVQGKGRRMIIHSETLASRAHSSDFAPTNLRTKQMSLSVFCKKKLGFLQRFPTASLHDY